jgi:hypothetical protein
MVVETLSTYKEIFFRLQSMIRHGDARTLVAISVKNRLGNAYVYSHCHLRPIDCVVDAKSRKIKVAFTYTPVPQNLEVFAVLDETLPRQPQEFVIYCLTIYRDETAPKRRRWLRLGRT